ncbi:MAG: HEAT repeat domain-containing protein [Bacteroidota bacterium]|nr:HEAT repeat domain-containing protein [Bacteroidota bacterium]
MSFYDLSKAERVTLVASIKKEIASDLTKKSINNILHYFSDEDTYIRKAAYLSIGRIYFEQIELQKKIISLLEDLLKKENFKIRQTVINAAGEIGIKEFEPVERFFDTGLFDKHHSPRNAVIGSIKKMSEKNPKPILKWAKKYLHHTNKEIRREICHGIELRGRTHPQDILPLLKELQFDTTARVKNTLVHVLGQIAYKKGCLETVIADLNKWQNKELVLKAIDEIIDVHYRYRNFSVFTQKEAITYINKNFKNSK